MSDTSRRRDADDRSEIGSQETGSQGDTTRGEEADDSMISGQDDDASEDADQSQEDDDEADRRASTGSRSGGGGGTVSSRQARTYQHLRIRATATLPLTDDPVVSSTVREIGKTACWSLSTAKPGNGVEQLRDSSLDTYWQSDGLQPHYINIQFARRQTVCAIALFCDFNLDESYTPKRMKIRVGETFHNLEEVRVVELREPRGWCVIPLWRKWGEDVLDSILDPDGDDDEEDDDNTDGNNNRRRTKVPLWKRKPMRTHFVQIGVTSMHQNGRDTHIRQVKIFGPREDGHVGTMMGRYGRGFSSSAAMGRKKDGDGKNGGASAMMSGKIAHTTQVMCQFSTIR
jgi:anaphase-promoting complex subunit 10